MNNQQPPRVYQIDFTALASGKRIASSKRRVRWRFGFANPEALAAGETGTACRGEEHDVTLVWSVTSGKRVVLADGQEVHFSTNRNAIFDFSWTMRGNHVLKIVAYSSPPLTPTPGWRQYDFFVDGQSFFTFPKVFRLGLSPNDPRAHSPRNPTRLAERGERHAGPPPPGSEIATLEAPSNPHEEEAYLQEAIRQSLADDGTPLAAGAASTGGGGDLLDFGAPAPAAPASDPFGMGGGAPPAALPPSTTPTAVAPYGAAPYGGGYQVGQTQPPGAPMAALPAAPANGYAPAPSPFAPPAPIATQGLGNVPPQQLVTPPAQATPSSIGFASPPADFSGFAAATPQQTPAPSVPSPSPQQPALQQPEPQPPAPAQQQQPLTMNSLSGQEGLLNGTTSDSQAASGSMADQAYAKLVNMDAFSLGNPSSSTNHNTAKANPFENAALTAPVGGTQSLADMKSQKDSTSHEKKGVMNAPPNSAMVVSGTQNGQWGGAYGQQLQLQHQQPMYGAPPMQQQPMYGGGMQPPQQPSMGGPPPLAQPGGFGQAQMYGQQPPQMYGQQPPQQQQQQPMYGQQPSPYGGPPGGF